VSAVPIVGVSGADGSGKSTFAVALAESVHRAGGIASVLHLYGCVACRRVRPQALPARLAGRREAAPLRAAHALVDAAEAWLRLSAARRHLARRARRSAVAGAVMLVTDRSPLDGLAKHDPTTSAWPARAWLALAARYRCIVVLDAPAQVLALRDCDHGADDLERSRARFRAWLPAVMRALPADARDEAARSVAAAASVLGYDPSALPVPVPTAGAVQGRGDASGRLYEGE